MEICPNFLHFFSIDKIHTDVCKKSLFNDFEFRENTLSECHTFLTGLNEFLYLLPTFISCFRRNSV
jgi:hypothetical protein